MQLAPVGPLGVATAINFQPTAGGKAAITGPFPRWRGANPVIAALRANGIEVTAVHSHMLTEQPPGVIDVLNAEQGAYRRVAHSPGERGTYLTLPAGIGLPDPCGAGSFQ